MKRCLSKHVFLPAIFVLLINPLYAQVPPVGQEAGPQAQRFREAIEKQKKQFEPQKAILQEHVVAKELPAQASSMSFLLMDIRIMGVEAFDVAGFKPLYQHFLGKMVSLEDVQQVADKISACYKIKGYLTAIVYIPEQDVKDGIVEIRVAEGKMGKLEVEGNRWFSTDFLKRHFHNFPGKILDISVLGRDIVRLNKNPDIQVKSIISEGKVPQTSDITLKVQDRYPQHIGGGGDNQGTRLVGRERGMMTFRSTNLTGKNDSAYANVLFGKHAFAQAVTYLCPVDSYGTKVGFTASHLVLRVAKEFTPFDMTGETNIFTPFVVKELYLSEDVDVELNAGIDIESTTRRYFGQRTADDQLRVPYLGFDYFLMDSSGQTTVSPRMDVGMSDFLGASSKGHPSAGRAGTGGKFETYALNITRVQKLVFSSYATMRARLQYSTFMLPSSRQLQLGGANSIRGYPEGDYLADQGVILNLDWVSPAYFIPQGWRLPCAGMPLRNQIEPVLFFDWGSGRLNRALPGERRSKVLAGVGGGFRVHMNKNIFTLVEWAKDIGPDKPVSGAGAATFYWSVQSEF